MKWAPSEGRAKRTTTLALVRTSSLRCAPKVAALFLKLTEVLTAMPPESAASVNASLARVLCESVHQTNATLVYCRRFCSTLTMPTAANVSDGTTRIK
eukprot:2337413-Prymnesium_polylepis.2